MKWLNTSPGVFGGIDGGAAFVVDGTKYSNLFVATKALFRLGARAWARCSGTKMDVVHTRQCPGNKNVHKQLGKGNNYREISGRFGVVTSTAYEKVNTTGTDENLFRLVPVPGDGAQVLPLESVPVPRHGAQISVRAPTKGYVQTGARARVRCPN